MRAVPWGWDTFSSFSAAAPARVTNLRVTEVRRDSVTLAWTPVPGASSYILSWSPPAGGIGWTLGWGAASLWGLTGPHNSVSWVAAGGETRRTVPGTASSQQVSGLRLGQSYTFTLRPLLGSVPGAETSVSERTGAVGTMGTLQAGLVSAPVATSPLLCSQSAGMPVVTLSSWCMAPVTVPLVLMPSAPSFPTLCPPWGAWALRAHRYDAATSVGTPGGAGEQLCPPLPCTFTGGSGHIQLPQPALAIPEPLQRPACCAGADPYHALRGAQRQCYW